MKPANSPIFSSPLSVDYSQLVEDVLAPEDIHDAHHVQPASVSNGLFLILAVILSVLHAVNLYLFLESGVWTIIPIFIHLILTAVTGIIALGQYKKGMDARHFVILAVVSATTGIFGTLGALLGFIGAGIFSGRARHFKDWYETIFPSDTLSEPQVVYDRIIEGFDENPNRYSVMPFVDVMRVGSENQKRRALAKMTARFNPRFSEAFRIALRDPSNTIRVQAATAVAKIEKEFTYQLERIELARTQEPKNATLTLALAKFYDDYAFTGVLDPEREKINRERAIGTYKTYLQQDPNSTEAWMAIGRLMLRNRQYEEAADWFRSALDRGIKAPAMIMWYFDCLFRLKRFRELRHLLLESGRNILGQQEVPVRVRDAVSLWIQVA